MGISNASFNYCNLRWEWKARCYECSLRPFENGILVRKIINVNADESIFTDGHIDFRKLKPISFDPVNNTYLAMGDVVENALKLK